MGIRCRWIVVLPLCLGAAAWAAAPAKDAKDKGAKERDKEGPLPPGGTRLPGTSFWYMLDEPQDFDSNKKYPLVVLATAGPDQAKQTFEHWLPQLKKDGIFVACLNAPKDWKDPQDGYVAKMVEAILDKRDAIDSRRLILLGHGAGAEAAIHFVLTAPRYFARAIALSPSGFPDLSLRPRGDIPARAAGQTALLITKGARPLKDLKDAKEVKEAKKQRSDYELYVQRLLGRGIAVSGKLLPWGGAGGETKEELALALEYARRGYPPEKQRELKEIARLDDEKARAQKEENKEKGEKGKEPTKKGHEEKGKQEKGTTEPGETVETPKPATKQPEKSADELLEEAGKLVQDRKFAAAVRAYEQLAKLKPGSEYERVAVKQLKDLRDDPRVRQAIADEGAGPDCRRWLMAGRNWLGAKNLEKATAEFRKVVTKYPDTSYAEEARKEIERIEAGQ